MGKAEHPSNQMFCRPTKIGAIKNYQCGAEGQKRHQNFSTSAGKQYGEISGYFLGKLLPVLVFTGAAPRRVSTSSGKKTISHVRKIVDCLGCR